jgi:hypothetical protein
LGAKNQIWFLGYWRERMLGAKEKLFGASSHGERVEEMRMGGSQENRRKEREPRKVSEKNSKE